MNQKRSKVIRQPLSNRFVHWTAAISIFMLIITGLGQMPLYGRYLGPNPPALLAWLQDYEVTLWLHYLFATVLIFILIYHIIFHALRKEFDIVPRKGDVKASYHLMKAMILKKEEPPSEKYLPEQRLAYAFFAVSLLLVVVTGIAKVYQNIAGVQPSNWFFVVMAAGHNIATVMIIMAIIGHLAAFIFKANRHMLPGMFTGKVDKEYVEERHSLWYEEMKKNQNKKTS
ncbi:formate dehydrogenase subunit gamma [Salisediminibacterium halotolerans]|uniref:formate dehydrogenase subunit gamma n=1 Tax=Salisediminibacterium halotolerans TaxID=517425 RepID=UPI000EB2929B|nr:cytochrome b/b6 domain-containing protein [Salisediminibacterium halotolerans]RLJ77991.1 formate dehydrogenase gamma subunit [Actinophytocola xinjiangensis]RPE88671.1 formate dehydrogenase gamma subunit [Salisediminibacterium halotolerans]TWG36968.1 formate dehydrogenase gamma subunit [Salisediminibacterium halotolerans]GEL08419.1 membrane protein [Salisediminibacterium halotolerans]